MLCNSYLGQKNIGGGNGIISFSIWFLSPETENLKNTASLLSKCNEFWSHIKVSFIRFVCLLCLFLGRMEGIMFSHIIEKIKIIPGFIVWLQFQNSTSTHRQHNWFFKLQGLAQCPAHFYFLLFSKYWASSKCSVNIYDSLINQSDKEGK